MHQPRQAEGEFREGAVFVSCAGPGQPVQAFVGDGNLALDPVALRRWMPKRISFFSASSFVISSSFAIFEMYSFTCACVRPRVPMAPFVTPRSNCFDSVSALW